jgi:hypothetical protein
MEKDVSSMFSIAVFTGGVRCIYSHATVVVNYARQMYPSNSKGVSSSVASAAIEQAQWSMVIIAALYMYFHIMTFP